MHMVSRDAATVVSNNDDVVVDDGQPVVVRRRHPHLLAALREELDVTSPKDGCSPSGQCGCCTVLIDGKAVVSCQQSLEKVDGKAVQSARGKNLRHPFTGVHLALSCDVPDEVCHLIATHAGEGNMVARTTEAWLVHHADFMTYEPFVKRLEL